LDLETLNQLSARAKDAKKHAETIKHSIASLARADRSEKGIVKLLSERDPNGPFYTYNGIESHQKIAIETINSIIDEMKPEIIAIAIARLTAEEVKVSALSQRRLKLIEL
jgi:hypothetical protein